jgi:hypothetical protein
MAEKTELPVQPLTALTPGEQRKRAFIDAVVALVITMLIWPFPLARQMLTPLVNVLLVLLTWDIINVVYHAVCARIWRRTAGLFLLGYHLAAAPSAATSKATDAPPASVDDATAIRWGLMAGALVVVTAIWPGASRLTEDTAGAALYR